MAAPAGEDETGRTDLAVQQTVNRFIRWALVVLGLLVLAVYIGWLVSSWIRDHQLPDGVHALVVLTVLILFFIAWRVGVVPIDHLVEQLIKEQRSAHRDIQALRAEVAAQQERAAEVTLLRSTVDEMPKRLEEMIRRVSAQVYVDMVSGVSKVLRLPRQHPGG